MPVGNAKFQAAAKAAACNMLSTVGSTATAYAAWGLLTPGPFDEWAALGVAGVAGLAYAVGCQWDTQPVKPENGDELGCCPPNKSGQQYHWYWTATRKSDGFVGKYYIGNNGVYSGQYKKGWIENPTVEGGTGLWRLQSCGTSYAVSGTITSGYFDPTKWSQPVVVAPQLACADQPTPPPAPVPPYKYTDPDDGCEITVNFQGFVVGPGGTTGAAWKMEPATQQRASGGVIGGCNFSPVIVYQPPGGGGDGPPPIPWNPGPDGDGGEPWWMKPLRDLADALTEAAIQRIVDGIFGAKAPAVTYRLVSACETDAQGEPISQSREVTIPELPILNGLVARVDAMDDLMQGLKDFKQPVCLPAEQEPAGVSYSVQFRSVVVSPGGKSRLRKELRYRDQGNAGLIAHRDHWLGFEWASGPWQVISTGLPWGRPQVWASSPEEGKRVLAHAAAISGVNLQDPKHKWVTREVQNGRYGPQLKMVTHRDVRGVPWITTRDGSNGLPEGAPQLSSDPRVGA